MTDEAFTEEFDETHRGVKIHRLIGLRWPDGFCTVGFSASLPGGVKAYAPYKSQLIEDVDKYLNEGSDD